MCTARNQIPVSWGDAWKCMGNVEMLVGEGLQVHHLSCDYNTHLGEISLSQEEKGHTCSYTGTAAS